jgi:hypothetical protein
MLKARFDNIHHDRGCKLCHERRPSPVPTAAMREPPSGTRVHAGRRCSSHERTTAHNACNHGWTVPATPPHRMQAPTGQWCRRQKKYTRTRINQTRHIGDESGGIKGYCDAHTTSGHGSLTPHMFGLLLQASRTLLKIKKKEEERWTFQMHRVESSNKTRWQGLARTCPTSRETSSN